MLQQPFGFNSDQIYFLEHYDDEDENLYMDLQKTSTYPDTGFSSSPGPPTQESASFAVLKRRAADVLDIQMPAKEAVTS
ncbi:hypothetical protein NDU88_008916 [Pleurodeles waltl]|uniref:Uncharacterized protein n=1 Tax=Pleurodeles waltl TaxID=8319 RepID=A0AAV7RUJ4_PLEWA|nr:hypothetical protein NDU88_008916 [Pleurodeles waltl]